MLTFVEPKCFSTEKAGSGSMILPIPLNQESVSLPVIMASFRALKVFFLFFLFSYTSARRSKVREDTSPAREGKVFSLFNIVRFEQAPCVTVSDSALRGTCMTTTECQNAGGIQDGNCAAGFGACCRFVAACGTNVDVARNCTYLENAEFPRTARPDTTCSFRFQRPSNDICQIRLDFVNLVTASAPQTGANLGNCQTDTVTVVGASRPNPPVVCGTLTGQHMYIDARGSGTTTATFTFGAGAVTRSFRVKTTFVECSSPVRAPNGCLQYFTTASGSFQSFNFQGDGGTLLQNQNYQTCFRRMQGFCSIQFTESGQSSTLDPFNLPTGATLGVVDATAKLDSNCAASYISIQGKNHCGGVLSTVNGQTVPSVVTDVIPPFRVQTFTGVTTAGPASAATRGYSLVFNQRPCA